MAAVSVPTFLHHKRYAPRSGRMVKNVFNYRMNLDHGHELIVRITPSDRRHSTSNTWSRSTVSTIKLYETFMYTTFFFYCTLT